MRFVALALAALLVSPPDADACAAPHLVDVALTADGATLLDDGGVVIETRSGAGRNEREIGIGPTLASGRTQIDATMDWIAPGLSVLRPKRNKGRTITVVDGNRKVLLTLKQAKGKTRHTAPDPTSITSTLPSQSKVPSREGPGIATSTASLTLAAPADDDVIAIVVYLITKDGQQGVAYWRRTDDLAYTYRTGGKGCVPGPRPLFDGEQVAFAFLDKYGRTSPLSKALSVTRVAQATP
jgi:hypothetical protein